MQGPSWARVTHCNEGATRFAPHRRHAAGSISMRSWPHAAAAHYASGSSFRGPARLYVHVWWISSAAGAHLLKALHGSCRSQYKREEATPPTYQQQSLCGSASPLNPGQSEACVSRAGCSCRIMRFCSMAGMPCSNADEDLHVPATSFVGGGSAPVEGESQAKLK